jgi:uncharacterized protein (TIGR00251 family)
MIRLRIKAKPGSFKDEITIDEYNEWTVKIKAKPIDGEANAHLIKYLAKQFGLSKSAVIIEKGTTNQYKTIALDLVIEAFEELCIKFKK